MFHVKQPASRSAGNMLRRSNAGFTWNRSAKYGIISDRLSEAILSCNYLKHMMLS